MAFTIKIEPEAFQDIQEAITWYNQKQPKLGLKFFEVIKKCFKKLEINPFYQIRYDDVRCLPLQTFPFMVHYTCNEKNKLVVIRGVFNTSQNPKEWESRNK